MGNVPAEAGKWQVVGNVEYSVAAVPGLSIHANARYFDKAPTDDYNQLYIPGRTLANVGFQHEALIADHKVIFTGNPWPRRRRNRMVAGSPSDIPTMCS